MKAKRINKSKTKKVVIKTAPPSEPDLHLQAGNKVILHSLPKNIKKAKKIFKVDKKYLIQTPPKNHLNTKMGVYLKGNDDKVYQIGFPYFTALPK